MRQILAEIAAIDILGPFARVRIAAADFARALEPGRALVTGWPHTYLRRTWWPCAIDADSFSILATADMAPSFRAGDRIDIVGPIGHGFSLDEASRNILLIASGVSAGDPDIGPLLALLDRALIERRSVTLVYAAPSIEAAYPVSALPPAIEVIRAVDADLVSLLPDPLVWADQVFACGPADFAARLTGAIDLARIRAPRGFAQVLHLTQLACGTGACGMCRNGTKLACTDGPVFELSGSLAVGRNRTRPNTDSHGF